MIDIQKYKNSWYINCRYRKRGIAFGVVFELRKKPVVNMILASRASRQKSGYRFKLSMSGIGNILGSGLSWANVHVSSVGFSIQFNTEADPSTK